MGGSGVEGEMFWFSICGFIEFIGASWHAQCGSKGAVVRGNRVGARPDKAPWASLKYPKLLNTGSHSSICATVYLRLHNGRERGQY